MVCVDPRVPTYFLSFMWRRGTSEAWQPVGTVSAEHPLDFIRRARANAPAVGYEYCLMFFCEIPLEVYESHRPPTSAA